MAADDLGPVVITARPVEIIKRLYKEVPGQSGMEREPRSETISSPEAQTSGGNAATLTDRPEPWPQASKGQNRSVKIRCFIGYINL